jgi:hypothetical protein
LVLSEPPSASLLIEHDPALPQGLIATVFTAHNNSKIQVIEVLLGEEYANQSLKNISILSPMLRTRRVTNSFTISTAQSDLVSLANLGGEAYIFNSKTMAKFDRIKNTQVPVAGWSNPGL